MGLDRRAFLKLQLGAVATMLLQPGFSSGGEALKADLIIGCWPGYEKFFEEFAYKPFLSKNPGVKISMDIAPISQVYAKLQASKGGRLPVQGTAMNDTFCMAGLKNKMWQRLTEKQLPNLANVPPGLRSEAGPFWAINFFGITYNPKRLPKGISSWNELYDPKFKGKVGMWPAYFDAYIMAAKAAGGDEHSLEKGIAAWKKAKDNIGLWVKSVAEIHQAIHRGEILVAPDWGAAALRDAATGMDLAVCIPKEGAVMNTYYMQVLNGVSDDEAKALYEIFNQFLSVDFQKNLFKHHYLIPVVKEVQPDLSQIKQELDFNFTAQDAIRKLYRPDYAFIGENAKKIVELIDENLK
jgi:putative spermidine/putrescine transport system substrate-binding protein